MAYKLPLVLKVRDVRRSATMIEVDAVVSDAVGTNVRYIPLVMGPQNSVASVCAILQHQVNDLAQGLAKRGEAVPQEEATSDEERTQALEALVGKEFTGSVAT